MPTEKTIRCICGCGQVKGENNHWTVITKIPIDALLRDATAVNFHQWGPMAWRKGAEFLYGDACCQRILSQWLSARKKRSDHELLDRASPVANRTT
jgi:hypothetical protein